MLENNYFSFDECAKQITEDQGNVMTGKIDAKNKRQYTLKNTDSTSSIENNITDIDILDSN